MTNAAYFAHREEAELALARAAASPNVRDIHLDLASRYAMLAKNQLQADAAHAPGGAATETRRA
jgi:hypothetical protein